MNACLKDGGREGVLDAIGSNGSDGKLYQRAEPVAVLRMPARTIWSPASGLDPASGKMTNPIEKLYLSIQRGTLEGWKSLKPGTLIQFRVTLGHDTGGVAPYSAT